MPQHIKNPKGLVALSAPKIILQRPKLASLLGAVASEWGDVDNILSNIFNLITFAKNENGFHTISKISFAIFDESFTSYRAKIEVIKRILKLRYSEVFFDEFSIISSEMMKKSSMRNRLVHQSWQVCETFPEDLICFGSGGAWIRYTEIDFQVTLDDSVKVRNKLHDFSIKLSHSERHDADQ